MPHTSHDAESDVPKLTLDDVLHFDPLHEAERITGDRYGGDLGFGIASAHGELKRRMLRERDDTTLQNELSTYLRIVREMGFEVVGEYDFPGRTYHDEPVYAERLYIMVHRKWAALLCFDTYNETRVNGGHVYYQWRPAEGLENPYRFTSSGGWHDYPNLWSGYHDCREALRHNMRGLDNAGSWVNPWRPEGRPFLWLHGYNEIPAFDSHDYKTGEAARSSLVRHRIMAMPEWALEMFLPALAEDMDESAPDPTRNLISGVTHA